MTQTMDAPPRPPQFYDENTREYLLRLQSGIKPNVRPEFGRWEQVVQFTEKKFDELEPEKRVRLMPKILKSIGDLTQFQRMNLAALLNVPTDYRSNARAYLKSLVSGVKPAIRPEFGAYARAIAQVEAAFAEHKTREECKRLLPRDINTIGNQRAFKDLRLPQLLTEEETTEQGEEATEEDKTGMPALPDSARLDPELALEGCQWLDKFIEYSKEVSPEGYEDFHEGVGLWVLSVVIAGRATIFHGNRGVGTSLNIGLVADTTMTAKTETANAGIDVLESADLRWLLGADETTPQKLLSDMAGNIVPSNYDTVSIQQQQRMEQRLALAGQRGWFYDEFGSLLRSMSRQNGPMADFKGLLLKVDGSMKSYTYATKVSGTETITTPRLSLLCCMTLPDLKACMKNGGDDLANGFFPRFALICPPADLMIDKPFDLRRRSVPYSLSEPLRELHERLGMPDFTLTVERDEKTNKVTGHRIDRKELPVQEMETDENVSAAWIRYRSALKSLVTPIAMKDFRGFYGRYPALALRIATLFACLEDLTVIEMRHWAKAQEITERWRKSLHELYNQVNTSTEESPDVQLETKLLAYFEKHASQSFDKRTLQKYVKVDRKSVTIDKITHVLTTLQREKLIHQVKFGSRTQYQAGWLEE